MDAQDAIRAREDVLLERAALLDRLAGMPGRVGERARGLAARDEAAGGPPAGEWSAREIVGHLVSVERAVWQARLDTLDAADAGSEPPRWAWTEPGPADDPEAATLEGALGLFVAVRSSTLARVTALDDAGWGRVGIHATYGRLEVADLLRIAADHDDEHLTALEARAGDA